jgi:type I restriction enzyme S subunit
MTIQSHSREGGNPLPQGWATTNLEMLTTDISYGYTASSSAVEVGPKMLRITDIQDNSVAWSEVPYCEIDGDKIDKYLLRKNDLVFARTGATVGKSFLIKSDPPEAVYASYLIRVRTASTELISLLNHFFNSHQYWQQITEFSAGIGQPNVNGTKLKGLAVTLPPLAEQKVIADKLDTLLAQVETTKARLDRIPQILKTFRQSVLAAAVSGKLTGDWREKHPQHKVEKKIKIDEISDLVTKGASPKWQGISYVDDKSQTLFVTSENVGNGRLLLEEPKFVEDAFNEKQRRSVLIKGDVLTNIVGASIGRATIWDLNQKANINQAVCLIRLDHTKCTPEFMCHYLNSPTGIEKIVGNKVDVARANVSLTNIKDFVLDLPSIKEQTEIVRRVEELFAFADNIEQKTNTALDRVNKLTQSILAKAFRGELTADWRAANPELISGDNSAEALLAKIKAERDALKPPKKVRNKKVSI